MSSKTYTIGFYRADGDFQVLATVNNNDQLMTDFDFDCMTAHLVDTLAETTGEDVQALSRQDTPDYVTIED